MTASTAPREGALGKVITFYSYKGGTGRTMALANVAWILASNGYRVLAVDWDLESPGLHRFFHPLLVDPELRHSGGVIDLIREHADAAVSEPGHPPADRAVPDVRRYAVSLNWSFASGGELDLLPAGRQGPAYSMAVSTFDWPSFHDRLRGNEFFAGLRQNLREQYDFALVDSRTGLSDSAGMCTVLLPDTVVNCFTLSTQSIEGAARVGESIVERRLANPVRMLPVPMRVEDGEQSKLDAGRDYAESRFSALLGSTVEDVARYWAQVEIPYKVYYAYEEILAVFGDRPQQPATLLAAYERLARVVTGADLAPLAPLDEPVRRYWLARFERTRPRATGRVLVSYAAEDRMWAEWIAGVLGEVGLTTILRDVATAAGEQATPETPADLVAVLLSSSYHLTPEVINWAGRTAPPGARARWGVLPISLDGTAPPEELERFGALELTAMSPDRARAALLAAINWPASEVPGTDAESAVQARFPGTPPRVSRIPLRNASFTGRRKLLADIRDHLTFRPGASTQLTLTGLGGVGKTQIAIEYAHRFAADYDVVWWVSARQSSMVRAALVDLADELHVPEAATTADRIRLLRDRLSQGRPHQRSLLIFDSADDLAELRDSIPTGPGHVLITSRDPAWGRGGELIEVQPFGREESMELLRARMPAMSGTDADRVAERLGDLPLAIEQAGAWLAATGMPVDRYLALVEHQLSRLLAENPPAGYERAGAVTWLLSLDRLREEAPGAARLVELVASFGSEPISSLLLYSRHFIDAVADGDAALRDDANYGRLITEARRYALVTFDEAQHSLEMHRLVVEVIQENLTREDAARYRSQVHHILVEASPTSSDEPRTWQAMEAVRPHVVPSQAIDSAEDDVRQFVLDAIRYLYRRGDFASSQELAELTLQTWRPRWPAEDLKVLVAKVFLANALRAQSRFPAALKLSQEAYDGLTTTVGPANQYSIMAMAGLGADLWVKPDFARAQRLFDEALARSRELYGPTHRRAYRALNNVAAHLERIGRYPDARRVHEEAYTGRRQLLGERHPETLYSATSYGRALRSAGDLRASNRLLEGALAGNVEIHGLDNASTLRSRLELAATLRRLGDLESARTVARDAYTVYVDTQQRTHVDRLACANVLALTLSAMGSHGEALLLGRESADGHRELLGAADHFTLAVTGNVAVFLRRLGELAEAAELAHTVVDGISTVLGPSHPHALAASIIEANIRFAQRDPEAARTIEERVYREMEQVLGATHPDRLVAGANLISSRRAVGATDGLADLVAEVSGAATRTLGRDHPVTVAILDGERWECELDLPQF